MHDLACVALIFVTASQMREDFEFYPNNVGGHVLIDKMRTRVLHVITSLLKKRTERDS